MSPAVFMCSDCCCSTDRQTRGTHGFYVLEMWYRINDVVSSFLESIRKEDSHVSNFEIEKQGCCPVCDEKLHDNESILRLPCEHVFHHDCLMPWLGKPAVLRTQCATPHS